MKNLLTFFIVCLVSFQSYAQDYDFRVMLNKGDNTYGSGNDMKKVVTGTKLFDNEILHLGADSYIALLHSSGVTMELKDAGEYKISDLNQKVAGDQSSLMQKYAKYIMNNITDENQTRLSATGAVKRSIYNIKVYMPEFGEYFDKFQTFDWGDIEGVDGYVVTIKDKFDDEIMKKETTKSEVSFDFSDPKLKNEELVVVYFDVKGEESNSGNGFGLKPLKDDRLIQVKSEVDALKSEFTEETPLKHLILASYFEENQLLSDALTHYKKAIELSPDVNELYEDFLIRANLKDKEN